VESEGGGELEEGVGELEQGVGEDKEERGAEGMRDVEVTGGGDGDGGGGGGGWWGGLTKPLSESEGVSMTVEPFDLASIRI